VIINFILVYKLSKEQSHGNNAVLQLPQYVIAKKPNIFTTLTQWLWEK